PGQCGETPDQGACSEDRPPQHDRRTQDDPIDMESLQGKIALVLRGGKIGDLSSIDTDRRKVDDATDSKLFTGFKKSADACYMGRIQILTRTVLQHADAIDHRVHALKGRTPGIRRSEPRHVGLNPL